MRGRRGSAASSVRYEIGIFAAGAAETAAHGHFVHVYVDRATRRPVPLPDRLIAFVKEPCSDRTAARPPARSMRRSPRATRSAPSCRRRCRARRSRRSSPSPRARRREPTRSRGTSTVLTGDALEALSRAVVAAYDDPSRARPTHTEEYAYYPTEWRSPFIDRRRKVGWDLYGLLGIAKTDKERMHAQHRRNYEFFGAPVGLMFTIDRIMRQGSWLDFGMFLQNMMVAARGRGLDTCPQAAFTPFHRTSCRSDRRCRRPAAGLRHVARLARPGRDREHAGHRARAGRRLRPVPRLTARSNPHASAAPPCPPRSSSAAASFPTSSRACASTSRSSPTTPTTSGAATS